MLLKNIHKGTPVACICRTSPVFSGAGAPESTWIKLLTDLPACACAMCVLSEKSTGLPLVYTLKSAWMCCEPRMPIVDFESMLHCICPESMHISTGMPQESHFPSF